MLPDQRRGYWAAIAHGLLTLLGAFVSPLLLLMAAIEFAFAWGIRRGQMWAPIAAVGFHVMPLPLVLWEQAGYRHRSNRDRCGDRTAFRLVLCTCGDRPRA